MSGNPPTQIGTRVRELFTGALACADRQSRTVWLDQECGKDGELRARVEVLLSESTLIGDFLEKPAVTDPTRTGLGDLQPGEAPGDQMGPYRLVELVGEGGGGSVYRAEQEEPVHRMVALKILKLGMDTKTIIRRFETERQALAVMDHPNIARVLDAGASEDGRPYFVMDFVEGEPLTDYCDANSLTVQERIALFVKVCRAVEHAHQKGIIHRDLKPSNILVTEQDGEASPKVIDFGVAKAIDPHGDDDQVTVIETIIGTPAYMSPEQAERDRVDVDTRSDVWSLGVLLYELLTSYTPLDRTKVKDAGIDDLRQAFRDHEPYRPSLKLRHSRVEDRPKIGMDRSSTIQKLADEVQGDLDWVIMCCLDRDRTRRYGSASLLAADLECYLRGEPVAARPPSASYRLGKFVRRNRAMVGASAVLLVMLVIGAIGSTWLAVRATTAEREIRAAHMEQSRLREEAVREREDAFRSAEIARLHQYVADINVSHQALLDGHIAKTLDLLERQAHLAINDVDLRGFEWRYLAARCLADKHQTLARFDSPVRSLTFSNSGEHLAIGTREELVVWDLTKNRSLITLPGGVTRAEFFPDGKRLVAASRQGLWVFHLDSGQPVFDIPNAGGALSLSSDGNFLASTVDGRVVVWETGNWTRWREFPASFGPLAFSPDSRTISMGTREGIALWAVQGDAKRVLLEDSSTPLSGLFPGGTRMVFSLDGKEIFAPRPEKSTRGVFYLGAWSVETGEELGVYPAEPGESGHSGVISALAQDRAQTMIATSSWDHSVGLWNFSERKLMRALHGHRGEVWSVAVSPEGDFVASGSKDGEVKLWPVQTVAEKNTVEGRWRPLSFSNDSNYLGILNREGHIAIINTRTKEEAYRLELTKAGSRFWYRAVSLSNDLSTLAEGLPDGVVRIRRLDREEETAISLGGKERVDFVQLSPKADSVVTITSRNELAWRDLANPAEPIMTIAGNDAKFSQDGGTLLVLDRKGHAVIWDVKSRTERVKIKHNAQSFGVRTTLSPDGSILALTYGYDDFENAVSLWDTSTGKRLGFLTGHKQGIWSMTFSPDGRTLATSSIDGTMRLWSVATQRELLSVIEPGSNLRNLKFSPNGEFLVGASPSFRSHGELRLIHAPPRNFEYRSREDHP